METRESPIAIVTGGNRGIGKEIVNLLAQKNYVVIMTGTNDENVTEVSKQISRQVHGTVIGKPLDFLNDDSIENFLNFIEQSVNRVDILINNAGVLLERKDDESLTNFLDESITLFDETMRVNVRGHLLLTQKIFPIMKKHNYGRIVNVTSGMGRFADMDGFAAYYRISKAALNAVTCIFAAEAKGFDILVNAVCPGWVKTSMGGSSAKKSPKVAAQNIVWVATLGKNSPSGRFFRDKKLLDWNNK